MDDEGGKGRQLEGEEKEHKGMCICPSCGYEHEHKKEQPCYQISCPECGTLMKKL